MQRKQMTRETVPTNKTTNGGNGGYSQRQQMSCAKPGMTGPVTATGKPTVKAMVKKASRKAL
jgi:hypothetical protein